MDWIFSFIPQAGEWWGASQPALAFLVLAEFFILELAGCIVPAVPGPAIVWVGMVILKIWVADASAN